MLHFMPFILALSALAPYQQTTPPTGGPTEAVQVARRTPAQPAPPPFNEKADAKAAINAAVDAAAVDGIRVLITWGANDDNGSTLFLATKRAPAVSQSAFFSYEYKTVNVNVGLGQSFAACEGLSCS